MTCSSTLSTRRTSIGAAAGIFCACARLSAILKATSARRLRHFYSKRRARWRYISFNLRLYRSNPPAFPENAFNPAVIAVIIARFSDVNCGWQISKISVTRSLPLSFHASCSMVSSNTHALPGSHARDSTHYRILPTGCVERRWDRWCRVQSPPPFATPPETHRGCRPSPLQLNPAMKSHYDQRI